MQRTKQIQFSALLSKSDAVAKSGIEDIHIQDAKGIPWDALANERIIMEWIVQLQ